MSNINCLFSLNLSFFWIYCLLILSILHLKNVMFRDYRSLALEQLRRIQERPTLFPGLVVAKSNFQILRWAVGLEHYSSVSMGLGNLHRVLMYLVIGILPWIISIDMNSDRFDKFAIMHRVRYTSVPLSSLWQLVQNWWGIARLSKGWQDISGNSQTDKQTEKVNCRGWVPFWYLS